MDLRLFLLLGTLCCRIALAFDNAKAKATVAPFCENVIHLEAFLLRQLQCPRSQTHIYGSRISRAKKKTTLLKINGNPMI